MPCYSTIRTKLTDGERIESALRDLGYEVQTTGAKIFGRNEGRYIQFAKSGDTFVVSGSTNTDVLKAVSRKYAELGVRTWAKTKGYNVTKVDEGRRITLINRRG